MKYIFNLVSVFLILIIFSANGFSKEDELERGKRYIKLANTYIQANDYKKANEYLEMGINNVSKFNSFDGKYWKAVGLEYYGYLFLKMNMPDYAKEKLQEANVIYKQIISQADGSPYAISKAIARIEKMQSDSYNNDEILLPSTGDKDDVKNWSNMMLEKLPDEIYQLNCVKNIILSDNYFSDFPMGLSKFGSCLEYLDISNNFIEELPYNINEFKKLKFLDLSNNNIMEINNKICELKNLRFLNLQGNRISFEEITNLIRCLPNANIKFDKYEKVDEDEDMLDELE